MADKSRHGCTVRNGFHEPRTVALQKGYAEAMEAASLNPTLLHKWLTLQGATFDDHADSGHCILPVQNTCSKPFFNLVGWVLHQTK